MKKLSVSLIAIYFLFGCASQVEQHTFVSNIEPGTAAEASKKVAVEVKTSKYVYRDSNLSESIKDLSNAISTELKRDLPEIKLVESSDEDKDIIVRAEIEEFRYVSGFSRFMTGILVGDAVLKIRVRIFDSKTNKLLSDTTFDTQSRALHGIFGATTPRQIAEIAKAISNQYKEMTKTG